MIKSKAKFAVLISLVTLVMIISSTVGPERSVQEIDLFGIVTDIRDGDNRASVLTIDTPQGIREVEIRTTTTLFEVGKVRGPSLGDFVSVHAQQLVEQTNLFFAVQVLVYPDRRDLNISSSGLLSGTTLSAKMSSLLLPWASANEIEGTIINVDRSTLVAKLTIQSKLGQIRQLDLAVDVRIVGSDTGRSLYQLAGVEANIKFDGLRQEAILIEIDRFPRDVDFTSGVVTSTPDNQFQQITITRDTFPILGDLHPSGVPSFGPTLTLYIRDDTVIHKDGKPASAFDVALGDFVRPNTSFNPGTLTLTRLELKSPKIAIAGTVVGIAGSPEAIQLTLDTFCCGLLIIHVDGDTEFIADTGSRAIELRDQIGFGSHYDPMTGRSLELNVVPVND